MFKEGNKSMSVRLNTSHFALSALILIICGFLFISYSWSFFSTFTQQQGLNSDLYYYYRVSRMMYSLYNLFMAVVALLIIARIIIFILKNNRHKLTQSFVYFLCFLISVIVCELYLHSRFVGKG